MIGGLMRRNRGTSGVDRNDKQALGEAVITPPAGFIWGGKL
jgi:hypothetical protein